MSHKSKKDNTWTPLVPMQTEGVYPPLYCIHPIGGATFCYMQLARNLKEFGQPVYGIQVRGLIDGQKPYKSIEDAASNYISAIQLQTGGPFNLLGWSFGGIIAFEMARQIKALGDQVTFLALLDTVLVNSRSIDGEPRLGIREIASQFLKTEDGFRNIFQRLTGGRGLEPPKELITNIATLSHSSISKNLADYLNENKIVPGIRITEIERIVSVCAKLSTYGREYEPRKYNGEIIYYYCKDDMDCNSKFRDAWRPYANKVVVREAPGNHSTMLHSPNVNKLSKSIWIDLKRSHR
jgi:thioesterase domain-containing protein